MRITVCGAGPAGIGMAACLMSCGHEVVLYEMPDFIDRLAPFQENPEIISSGRLNFTGKLAGVTGDAEEALKDADVVFIVMHAAAHGKLGKRFAANVRSRTVFVLCPGYIGGGLELLEALRRNGAEESPSYVEFSSLPITSTSKGREVLIKAWKRNFVLYCPAELQDHEIVSWTKKMYSPVNLTASPLEPGLNEINIIVHAVTTLLNIGKVEGKEPWKFYLSGLTPSIIRVIEAIDAERLELERALGLQPRRLTDLLYEFYGDQGMATPEEGLLRQLRDFGPFATVPGPLSLEHRFISEDLRYGIVPMVRLGEQKGLTMPTTRALVRLASIYTGRDELNLGRHIFL